MDTNAINILCDKFYGKSKRSISLKYEILFSSPSLDELINCGSQMLQSELSDFMWQISNRKILLDLKGLIILEVNALLQNKTLTIENYFDPCVSCMDAWKDARRGMITNIMHNKIKYLINQNKQTVLNQLKASRREWLPQFNETDVLPKNWNEAYVQLSEDKKFNSVLLGMMKAMNVLVKFNDPELILNLDYKHLNGISIGLEFYCALRFIIDSHSRVKGGKPDAGDMYDIEHAFYVGLSDYFVTDDKRNYHILHDLIRPQCTKIVTSNEFYSLI